MIRGVQLKQPKKLLVEFEGYQFNKFKKFIIKEIAFYDFTQYPHTIYNYFLSTTRFNSKLSKMNTNLWLVKYYHLIPFDFGRTTIYYINRKYFNRTDCHFYVKGLQKQQILQSFTQQPVFNLEEVYPNQRLPTIYDNSPSQFNLTCAYINHTQTTTHCSLNKINKLAYWVRQQDELSKNEN
jgi:hypothetical protein